MFCPECGKEISSGFKFCPHCGFNLQEAMSSVSSESAAKEKRAFSGLEPSNLAQQFGSVETGPKIYQNAKLKLREMGFRMGYTPLREYFFKETVQPQQLRKIDIVWKSTNGFAAAFNIKSKSWGLKSTFDLNQLSRLANFNAEKKYIVNVSKKDGTASFIEVTDEVIKSFNLQPTVALCTPSAAQYKAYSMDMIRQSFKRAYEKWSPQEDEQLSDEYGQGLAVTQIADKHQRLKGAIYARLAKLGLIDKDSIQNFKQSEKKSFLSEIGNSHNEGKREYTFLVKSEKNTGVCIACLDGNKRWIRPITAGGFTEKDLIMNNGKQLNVFDVVETRFDCPFPILHHKENMKFTLGTPINYSRTLSQNEQASLLSEISNNQLLDSVNSKEQLFDELSEKLKKSLVLVGPVSSFRIQYNVGDNHPRIWFLRQKVELFSVSCTDIGFCTFMKNRISNTSQTERTLRSQDIPELRDKQTYFVIGLTGDSLDINNVIKDGKWHGRYWPLVVGVLTIPSYSSGD